MRGELLGLVRLVNVHDTPEIAAGALQRYLAAEHDGMRIPLAGEVEWHLPDRHLPYWRGRITEVAYEYGP
jgi:hypothetical protein